MKGNRNIAGFLIAGLGFLFFLAACDAAGSMAGDRDTLWQEVKESASYTVTFNTDGGLPVPARETVRYGGKVTNPDNTIRKTGNLFMGWFKEPECTNEWDFENDTVKTDITLYAGWEEVVGNAVTFIVYSAKAPVKGQGVPDGGYIIQPDNPEQDGFIFDKWYKEASFTTPWNFASERVTSDMTLYGKWLPLADGQYAVRFKAEGGSPVPMDQAVSGNGKVSDPQMQGTKDGYTFGGWYRDMACTAPWLFDIDTISGETSIYAQWNEGKLFTVNFYTDGGMPAPAQQFLAPNAFVTKPEEDPAKTDYIFGGWYWYNSFESNIYIPWTFESNQLPGNLILYAVWTPITYSILFHANDGSDTSAAEDFTYDEEKPLDANAFTNAGHTFAGWNTEPDGTGESYSDSENVKNLTGVSGAVINLYAQWTAILYTVSFDTDGGTPAPAQQFLELNASVPRPGEDPAKTGYIFGGWYWYNSFEDNVFALWTFDSNQLPGDLILYAVWTPITYSVMFHANDGSDTSAAEDFTYDEEKPLDANAFTCTGHTFSGWNTEPGGTGERYANSESVENLTDVNGAAINLYAQWTANQYTVSFDTAGGSSVPPRTIDYGTKLARPADPVKEYTGIFPVTLAAGLYRLSPVDGWYMDAAYTTEWNFDTDTVPDRNITLYAKWGTQSAVALAGISDIVSESVSYVNANPAAYTLLLGNDVPVVPVQNLNVSGVSLTLLGKDNERTISLSGNGSLFTVRSGVTLVLGDKVTLKGHGGNSSSLVDVEGGGKMVMNGGAKVCGNSNSGSVMASGSGGGVYVGNGSFIMNNGEISGNTASRDGGGVCMNGENSFTMNGGAIFGNEANTGGGGVWVGNGSSFIMSGGVIGSTNSVDANSASWGGGVFVYLDGTFTMSSGEINGNTATNFGGGVYMNGRNFTMNDTANISGNTAVNSGGGVYMNGGTFSMSGEAIITRNTSLSTGYYTGGGGVFLHSGIFTISGGTISRNIAITGGGVYVDQDGTLTMNGGAIITFNTSSSGGGVYIALDGTFTMNDTAIIDNNTANYADNSDGYGGGVLVDGNFSMGGGTISHNTTVNGGGVYVDTNGTFTMSGESIITLNTSNWGGGVSVSYWYLATSVTSTFTMSGGEISGNTAVVGGGGVWVNERSHFTKTGAPNGGTIYGYAAGDTKSNVVGTLANPISNAVWVDSTPPMRRETTAGPTDNIDSATGEGLTN